MRIPNNIVPSSPFMDNYFCFLGVHRLAFVVISKNCVTYLKQLSIYNKTGQVVNKEDDIHHIVGFTEQSDYLINVSDMPDLEKMENEAYFKIAVWRDPVKRLISTYKFFCMEREYREYFRYLGFYDKTISFERFLEFVIFELSKENILLQDEHLRCQSNYYQLNDIDLIIEDCKLNSFLQKQGLDLICKQINQTTSSFTCPDIYIEQIEELYKSDYELFTEAVKSNKLWR